MTVDYHKLSQVMTPIAIALPDVVLLLEQINISPGTWHAAVELAKAFFSIPVSKDHWKQFVFIWQGLYYLTSGLYQFSSPVMITVHRDLSIP